MMNRRTFLCWLTLGTLSVPLVASAQPVKVPRIGLLGATSASAYASFIEAFRQGLRDLGYMEGKNITIEYRWAEGRSDRLPDLAAELVQLKVALIVTHGTLGTKAARQATSTIPIVMAVSGSSDPVATGLVASLARPGGNVTGLSSMSFELFGKKVELLNEAVPRLSRIAILWENSDIGRVQLKETEAAALALGLQLQAVEVRTGDDLEKAFRAVTHERAGALVVPRHPTSYTHRDRIAELAVKYRLPAMYDDREYAQAGGLMTYGPSFAALWRRAAYHVSRILKGAKPADLPVEQPTD